MRAIANDLEKIVTDYGPLVRAIAGDKMSFKPSPVKWSKREIIGHLVDSAQNNIRRFIVAQYENEPHIVYNQDKWVAISKYNEYNTEDLVRLWELLNGQIAMILKNTSDEAANRTCLTQEKHTIGWLAEDYVRHLKHHLHQVLGLEPVTYP